MNIITMERNPRHHIPPIYPPGESFPEYVRNEFIEDFQLVKDGVAHLGRALLALPSLLQRNEEVSNGNQ